MPINPRKEGEENRQQKGEIKRILTVELVEKK